jgi:Tol biopolymer transport system component
MLIACGAGSGPAEVRGPGPVVLVCPGDDGVDSAICITGPDGKRPRRLTSGSLALDSDPELSADGERVAFVRAGAIWTMKADGSSPAAVIVPEGAIDYASPSWSPDGDEIAYVRLDDPSERPDVYVIDADGSDERRLTHTGDASDPTWSPDGDEIAFSRSGYHPRSDIFVVDIDEGDIRQLTRTAEDGEVEPDWSPDGDWIAYTRAISGEHSVNYMVFVMRSDGTDARILRDPGAIMNTSPVWSPDGTQIIYASERSNGDSEIWVASPDGRTEPAVLIDDAALE